MRSADSPKVYYVTEKGYKRWIPNIEVFNSYGNHWEDVVIVPRVQLDKIPNNILIRLNSGTRIYKIENETKHWITSPEALLRNGFSFERIAPVNQTEFDYYSEGSEIR